MILPPLLSPAPDLAATVRRLAADAVQADPAFLGRARVVRDADENTLQYRLTPVPPQNVLGAPGPLNTAVEAAVRVRVLRRDLAATLPGDAFPRLGAIEALAIRGAEAKSTAPKSLAAQFDALGDEIATAAKKRGLTPLQAKGDQAGYDVEIVLEPKGGKLRMMPYLVFRKCEVYKLPLDREWQTYAPGKHTLIGRYRYRALWPGGKRDEGNVSFQSDGSRAFSPDEGG